MLNFFKQVLSFIKKDLIIEKHYGLHFATRIIAIFFHLAVFYYLSKLVLEDFFIFIFIGILFSRIFFFTVSTITEIIRMEQFWGTLEALFLAPINNIRLTMLLFLSKFSVFLVEFIIYVLFGFLFFKFPLTIQNCMLLSVMVFLNIAAFFGLGLINASFVLIFKRGDPINWLVSTVVDLLSGVYFPTYILPPFLLTISNFLPTTASLMLFRGWVLKNTFEFNYLFVLIVTAIILLPVGLLSFNYAITVCRHKGNLGHY